MIQVWERGCRRIFKNKKMKFTQNVINCLDGLLSKYGFEIVSQSDNRVEYRKKHFYLLFVHDPREESCVFFVGRDDGTPVEVTNEVIKEYFKSDLRINNASYDDFSLSVLRFLRQDGVFLLQGDEHSYLSLESFNDKRIKRYNLNLITQGYLIAANKAWRQRDYSKFLRILSAIDMESLPPSFKRKYKIACEKVDDN